MLVATLFGSLVQAQSSSDLDKTPAWYAGEIPWKSMTQESRQKVLNMHAAHEENLRKAGTRGTEGSGPAIARGQQVIERIHKKYGIDAFYRKPSPFGAQMVIWLPENAWNALSPAERQSIAAYMKSNFANWGVGVGRVSGADIMADRIVLQP